MANNTFVKCALVVVTALTLLQILIFREFSNRHGVIDGRPLRVWTPEILKATGSVEPWPTLPSFQPWTPDPNLKPYTCEAYFGNGFVKEHRVLDSRCTDEFGKTNASMWRGDSDACGSFRCFYSETLRTSICEGKKMVMNPDRITVSRGGEALDQVMGREEEEELPEYLEGAFQVQLTRDWHEKLRSSAPVMDDVFVNSLIPRKDIKNHPLRSLLRNLRSVDSRSIICSKRVHEPTVFVTRYEYANLFHTSTDWFSAYISSRVAGLQYRPRIVLLDGHCESPMDDAWKAMFGRVTYAKHFKEPVCFDHAIFAPLGYDIPIFKFIESTLNCRGSSVEELNSTEVEGGTGRRMARLREFGEFFIRSFEEDAATEDSQTHHINVLFVRREDYLAHPRHSGKPQSRLSNEEEVFEALKKWAVEKSEKLLNVTIVNGLLAHMNMEEQVQAVKKADVLMGAHGAGMTHLLFAKPSTVVFELSSPTYRRPHFGTMSYWMGMDYRIINMDSSAADIDQVIQEMDRILEDVKRRKYM